MLVFFFYYYSTLNAIEVFLNQFFVGTYVGEGLRHCSWFTGTLLLKGDRGRGGGLFVHVSLHLFSLYFLPLAEVAASRASQFKVLSILPLAVIDVLIQSNLLIKLLAAKWGGGSHCSKQRIVGFGPQGIPPILENLPLKIFACPNLSLPFLKSVVVLPSFRVSVSPHIYCDLGLQMSSGFIKDYQFCISFSSMDWGDFR